MVFTTNGTVMRIRDTNTSVLFLFGSPRTDGLRTYRSKLNQPSENTASQGNNHQQNVNYSPSS